KVRNAVVLLDQHPRLYSGHLFPGNLLRTQIDDGLEGSVRLAIKHNGEGLSVDRLAGLPGKDVLLRRFVEKEDRKTRFIGQAFLVLENADRRSRLLLAKRVEGMRFGLRFHCFRGWILLRLLGAAIRTPGQDDGAGDQNGKQGDPQADAP